MRVNAGHATIMGLPGHRVMETLKSGRSAAQKAWMFYMRILFVVFGRCRRKADATRVAIKTLKQQWIIFWLTASKCYIAKQACQLMLV